MTVVLDFKPVHKRLDPVLETSRDRSKGVLDPSRISVFSRAAPGERDLNYNGFGFELRKKLTMQQILIDDVTNVR